jgi:hypothetical protein
MRLRKSRLFKGCVLGEARKTLWRLVPQSGPIAKRETQNAKLKNARED